MKEKYDTFQKFKEFKNALEGDVKKKFSVYKSTMRENICQINSPNTLKKAKYVIK